MRPEIAKPKGKRRRHSKEFKANVVAQCKPGVSVSAVALVNGLNANLVRRWCRKSGDTSDSGVAAVQPSKSVLRAAPLDLSSEFIPLSMTSGPREAIRVELVRGSTRVCVDWPVSAAEAAAVWLRDVTR